MSRRILVVDDEPVLRNLIQEVLEKEGFSVESADRGRTALARIREDHYDLVILDLALPDMNGILLCEKIQENHPQLRGRIVFVTGIGLDEKTSFHLRSLAGAYLEKPFEMGTLTGTVRNLLGLEPPVAAQTPGTA